MITRWDKWFADDNLAGDTRILAAAPTRSAENAAQAFLAGEKRSVPDLACGIRRDTFYLESRGLGVTGVEASSNGIWVAQRIKKERCAAATLIVTDARHLPFIGGSFEAVWGYPGRPAGGA